MTAPAARRADVVFVGGPIVTMAPDPGDAPGSVEALALEGGRIAALGDTDDVLALRDRHTEIVDLAGRALLPGLVEPHSHPDLCALLYAWVDVSGFTHAHVAGVEAALTRAVAASSPGEWIFAFGLDPMLTADLGTWDRGRLDALAPANPLVVMLQSMHTIFVNSAALGAIGLDDATPDPCPGFTHDGTGRRTGRVVEQQAIVRFTAHAVTDTADLRRRLVDQERRYAEVGITTVGLAGTQLGDAMIDVLADLARRDGSAVRLVAYVRHQQIDRLAALADDADDRFRVAGVKFWYDGSPYSGTMLVDEPYLDSRLCCCTLGIAPGSVGEANVDPEDLVAMLTPLAADGWQVLTHAQGDRGVREILDVYHRALSGAGRTGADHRWRLEHCLLAPPGELARALDLGVAPSFHVDHVRWYGPELRDGILGPHRCDHLMPVGTAHRLGHRVSLHADSPMYPAGPLRLAATAVGRRTRRGDRLAPAEAVDVDTALRAVTVDAAWQLGLEGITGSLLPGYRADLCVLETDPTRLDSTSLEELAVVATWLDGDLVHGTVT